MSRPVIVTCAVTGGGDTVSKSAAVPISPLQIAADALDAAKRGAAIVHCHVRDLKTGAPSIDPSLFLEVARLIREQNQDVLLNFTTGIAADIYIDDEGAVLVSSDLSGAATRTRHLASTLPEICSLDCGTMNFGNSNGVFVNIPDHVRAIARRARELGIKPELEVFDLGHMRFALQIVQEGQIAEPPLFQICLGIPWGAPADSDSMAAMVRRLPPNAVWSGFGIGSAEFPMAAQAIILGGHVRVGLEDNLYLRRGVLASNGDLVSRAVDIIQLLNEDVASPAEARAILGLRCRPNASVNPKAAKTSPSAQVQTGR